MTVPLKHVVSFFPLWGSFLFNLLREHSPPYTSLSTDTRDNGTLGTEISPSSILPANPAERSRVCWWQPRLQNSPNLFLLSGPQKSPADPTRAWPRSGWAGLGTSLWQAPRAASGRARASALRPVSPPAAPAGWAPAVALGSPGLSTGKSKVKETRGRREAGGRSLQPGVGVVWAGLRASGRRKGLGKPGKEGWPRRRGGSAENPTRELLVSNHRSSLHGRRGWDWPSANKE